MEKAIQLVYRDFGRRPIALGCHKDNTRAERFYLRHWFRKTGATDIIMELCFDDTIRRRKE